MAQIRRNTSLRFKKLLALLMAMLVAVSSIYVYIDYRLKKIAMEFAMSEAKTIILDSANTAALSVLEEMNISYNNIAVLSRDKDGLVTSVEINSSVINLFKSKIASEVAQELAKHNNVSFELPIFAAFGYFYTAFYIPKISYSMELTTTAITDFYSRFFSAGINQVLHQIMVKIDLESSLAMPHYKTSLTTSTSLIAAETVIVGIVPDAFTEVVNQSDELVGDIFDYSAQFNGGKNGF
ncbi:MAG: hypothetical protein IKK77_06170 [Clostridia bacterium]|nr:hypothetical protein [Clostridia bacterium]